MNYSDDHEVRLRLILQAVASRIKNRVDSLDPLYEYKNLGIEGWFKVELVCVLKELGEKDIRLKNKGPDIILPGGLQIELKAATDFNSTYLQDGALKDNVPCIFLGIAERSSIERLKSISKIRVIDIFEIGGIYKWVVGCIVPATFMNQIKRTKITESTNMEFVKSASLDKLNNIESQMPQKKSHISNESRFFNPNSNTMAGRLDEILSVGGTWEELVAKVNTEAKKMKHKTFYTKGVLLHHIKYRRVNQQKTEFLRNMIINEEGIFPKNKMGL
jgi:hypothetical protein